ncbi:MAG: hypothetical protein AAB442_01995 [Patescibacteria group bacterium]
MNRWLSTILFILISLLWWSAPGSALAVESSLQSLIDANNAQLLSLQNKIAEYQKQLDALGTEKTTLKAAIDSLTITQQKLTTQIQATQNKIQSANLQIQKLSESIGNTEETIGENQYAIAKTLREIAQAQTESSSLITHVLATHSFTDAWKITDEAIQFNTALASDIEKLRATKQQLSTNRSAVTKTKESLVSLQQDLSTQKRQVLASKTAQQELLTQTKNQESNYQKLLSLAKSELASYSTFTTNAGGSKLLANQTSCDDWGCYYSQRDTLWGNMPLNGTRFRLASDGCLVTAMAMIMTHYGHRDVTPVTINVDSNNFASYYPAYLLFTIRVDGVTATRKAATIDASLNKGEPVVVGVHAYGGTHYVVLTSGSRGNYLMRDPYVANGKDISFSKHYSVSNIFGVSRVIISG